MMANWLIRDREGGEESKKDLQALFIQYDVKLAYLFGSHIRGEISQFSDVDIAVLFGNKQENRALDRLRVDLMKLLKIERIDLIPLNRAPPLLKYKVVREGKVLYGEKLASSFEARVLEEYFDFKPYEEHFFKKMEERLQRGEYGR